MGGSPRIGGRFEGWCEEWFSSNPGVSRRRFDEWLSSNRGSSRRGVRGGSPRTKGRFEEWCEEWFS